MSSYWSPGSPKHLEFLEWLPTPTKVCTRTAEGCRAISVTDSSRWMLMSVIGLPTRYVTLLLDMYAFPVLGMEKYSVLTS